MPGAFTRDRYLEIGYGGMKAAMSSQGLAVDEAATQDCQTASMSSDRVTRQIVGAVLDAQGTGDKNITVSGRNTLVMRGNATQSVMLFDEILPGQYLKLRYTGPDDGATTCGTLTQVFDEREAEIRRSSGENDPLAAMLDRLGADGS